MDVAGEESENVVEGGDAHVDGEDDVDGEVATEERFEVALQSSYLHWIRICHFHNRRCNS